MRILLISTAYTRYNARTFYLQAKTLAKHGHDVTILCSDTLPEEIKDGVRIISIGKRVHDRRFRRLLLSTFLIKKRLFGIQFDAIQIGSPECLPLVKYFHKQGVKLIVFDSRENHSGDIMDKAWIPIVFRPLVTKIYEYFEKKYVKQMSAVIVPTTFMFEGFSKFHNNVKMVTNYPPISKMTQDAIGSNDENLNLCFFGGLRSDDLHINVFHALKNVNNVKYNILSNGSQNDNLVLLNLATEIGVQDKITILPQVSYEDVPLFLQKNDVGIALRKYTANYGFKRGSLGVIKLFQYFTLGMPVICTDYEEWKIIIDNEKCGIYVNPYDVDAIKQAIIFMQNSVLERKAMGKNARHAFETKYNWETQVNNYLQVFEVKSI